MAKNEPPADRDRALREHVLELLRGGHAHVEFDRAVGGLPAKLRGAKPPGQPHTPWRLLEHLRIAQRDILDFSRDGSHVSPDWPAGYWPPGDAPPNAKAWDQSVRAFKADSAAMQELVTNPATDLLAPIPGGKGQTVLREALLVADHNAYHLGQLIIIRRLLGAWKD
ncbi:MAG: transporter [Phycisphaerales bacterium]|nr:transporter [Phycisphaerales bacterium]